MKKFFVMLAVALMAASASAQVVTSRTYVKSKKATIWYARLGVSFDNVAGGNDVFNPKNVNAIGEDAEYSIGSKAGMDVDFGFQRPIGNFGMYWGMELGIGTRGASMKTEFVDEEYNSGTGEYYDVACEEKAHIMTWNVKYSPFTIGYKYALTDDWKLDAHLGAYVSYDFAGGTKYSWCDDEEDEKLSFSQIKDKPWDFQCLDAGMQIGVGAWWKKVNLDLTYQRGFITAAKVAGCDLYSSNLMIRVGFAF